MNDTVPVLMTTPHETPIEVETVRLWKRLVASLLDALLLGLVVSALTLLVLVTDPEPLDLPPWNWFDQAVDYLHYRPGRSLLLASSSAFLFILWPVVFRALTPGRRLLGLRVIARDGCSPTRQNVLVWSCYRFLGIGLALIGVCYALIDRDRRTLYDRLCHLWVIEGPRAYRDRKSPNRRLPGR